MAAVAARLDLSPTCESEAIDAGTLFEQHSNRLFAYCLRYLGSRSEAEDAVQTTFLYAHRALQRGVVPQAEYPWLHAIAKNVCRWQQRTAARRGQLSTAVDLDAFPGREEDGDDRELAAGLSDALASIPEGQRRAIVLRELRGLSSSEVAARLGMSAPATYALLTRARRSLAHALETGARRPLHSLNLGTLLFKLKGLLAGGTAKVVAAGAVAGSVALGGVAIEKTLDGGRQPSPTPPAAVNPRTGSELGVPDGFGATQATSAGRPAGSVRPARSTTDGSSPSGRTAPLADPGGAAAPSASGDVPGELPAAGAGSDPGTIAIDPPKVLPTTPAPPTDPADLLPLPGLELPPLPVDTELPPLPVDVPPVDEIVPAVEDLLPDPGAVPPLPDAPLPNVSLPLPLPLP